MKKNFIIISDYFKNIKPNKKYAYFLFLSALISQILLVLSPLVYGEIIKILTDGKFEFFYSYLILYGVLLIGGFLFFGLNFKIYGYLYRDIYMKIQKNIINKLDKLNIDYFTSRNRGKLLNISNHDTDILASFGDKITDVIVMFLYVIFAFIIIFDLNYKVGLLVLLINILNIAIMNKANDKGQKIIRNKNSVRDKMTSYFNEMISGIKEIRTFNIMDEIKNSYFTKTNTYNDFHQRLINNRIIRNSIIPIIYALLECVTIFYLGFLLMNDKIAIDVIIIVVSYYLTMRNKIQSVLMVTEQIRVVKVSYDRYMELINLKDKEIIYSNNLTNKITGEIVFDNVSFQYKDRSNVLKNVSFKIPKHQVTTIVGISGSGKSTIFNLLLRFYKPDQGKIMIDDIDIYDFDKEVYSHNLSIVMQNPFLFNMSIKENLSLIDDNQKNIEKVCQKVGLNDFITSLPNKYDTIITEDAIDISGGEKQRLSIARTLLKESEIILLDEVTSSLDYNSSNNIYDLLDELKKEKTIITISHKVEQMKRADNILLVKNGEIVGFGNHCNLIKNNKYYQEICGLEN